MSRAISYEDRMVLVLADKLLSFISNVCILTPEQYQDLIETIQSFKIPEEKLEMYEIEFIDASLEFLKATKEHWQEV